MNRWMKQSAAGNHELRTLNKKEGEGEEEGKRGEGGEECLLAVTASAIILG